MGSSVKILIVEDLPSDADLARHEINKVLSPVVTRLVETETDFRAELQNWEPDLIISDFQLPAFDGMAVLQITLEKCPLVPVIILTGSMNEDTAVDCMKAGAEDYVIKEHIKRLGPALLRALEQRKIRIGKKWADEQVRLLGRSVEQSSVSIMITDSNGVIKYVNPFLSRLTGYSAEELVGENPRILQSGLTSGDFYRIFWDIILSGKVWEGEFINKKKNGELFHERAVVSPIVNQDGEITHFVSVKEDITEKKRMMEDLMIAKNKAEESDRLKSAFINNISHEIRTPLNGILGFAHILSEMDVTELDRKYIFSNLQKSSDRLLQTVSDYLNMAKIVSGQMPVHPKNLQLALLVEEVSEYFKAMCAVKKLSTELEITSGISSLKIVSDHELISNILKIFIGNAVKFTREGTITLGIMVKDGCLKFFVRDTGIGIPSDKLGSIFEIFMQEDVSSTRGFEGSGLGLAIAKGYANLLGGTISVTSELGKGSVFYLELPLDN